MALSAGSHLGEAVTAARLVRLVTRTWWAPSSCWGAAIDSHNGHYPAKSGRLIPPCRLSQGDRRMILQQTRRSREQGCTLSAFRSLTSLAWPARQSRLRAGSPLAKKRSGPRRGIAAREVQCITRWLHRPRTTGSRRRIGPVDEHLDRTRHSTNAHPTAATITRCCRNADDAVGARRLS